MLNKTEQDVMNIVFQACDGKPSCLITARDILSKIPNKKGLSEEKVLKTLKSLELDDYFDIIYSDRKGEEVFCISLHTKGFSFRRDRQQDRRKLYFKIGITVATAVLSFLITFILKKLFS